MADSSKPISELTEKSTFTGGDYVLIVSGGVTQKITADNLLQTKADITESSKTESADTNPIDSPTKAGDVYINQQTKRKYIAEGDADVDAWGFPVNPYRLVALVMPQSGTDDPEATFKAQDLYGAIYVTRQDVGEYRITSDYASEFPEDFTMGMGIFPYFDTDGTFLCAIELIRTSAVVITIKTYNASGVLADSILTTNHFIRFEIYNPLS